MSSVPLPGALRPWLVVTPVVTITHAITPPRPRARSHAGLPKDDFEAPPRRSCPCFSSLSPLLVLVLVALLAVAAAVLLLVLPPPAPAPASPRCRRCPRLPRLREPGPCRRPLAVPGRSAAQVPRGGARPRCAARSLRASPCSCWAPRSPCLLGAARDVTCFEQQLYPCARFRFDDP